tara:strand:+ start:1342 stop:1569 length:228 start_codon:yes stop_codon:yes gene_type:complete
MNYDLEKFELIRWLMNVEDEETIGYLKAVKQSVESKEDWWGALPNEAKAGIERGLTDVANRRVIPHEEVKKKYGF